MDREPLVTVAVVLVVLAGVGLAAYSLWPEPTSPPPPDPAGQTREESVKYMASEAFGEQDDEAKQEYVEAAREAHGDGWGPGPMMGGRDAGLSEAERQRLRENVRPAMRREMEERMDTYFELPPEEKAAYLDDIIDEMQDRRREFEERRRQREEQAEGEPSEAARHRPAGERRAGDGRRGPSLERMKERIETTDPEQRARFVQFFIDLRERMEERGIDMRRGPGHGPGR